MLQSRQWLKPFPNLGPPPGDVCWMRECGIDPEITAIEGSIKLGRTTKKAIHFGHARYA